MKLSLALMLLAVPIASGSASAAPASFTGMLEIYVGDGVSGLPPAPQFAVAGAGTASYSSTAFTLPAGVFTTNAYLPEATSAGGSIPLPPTPFTIYAIGSVINQSNQAGSFAVGSGPGGGFGGVMSSGAILTVQLGISGPTPGLVFGSLILPLPVGGTTSPGTAGPVVLANQITVSFNVTPWSTGAVLFDDRALGSAVTGTPLSNPFLTAGTVAGSNNLGSSGGTVSLVTPFTLKITGGVDDLRAGYGRLTLTFVPEPAGYWLLAAAAIVLLRTRRQNA